MPNCPLLRLYSVCVVLIFCIYSSVWAQHHASQLPHTTEDTYTQALDLFNNHHYEAAQIQFERYLNSTNSLISTLEAKKHVLLCKLYLQNPSAEQDIQRFVLENTQTPQAEDLNYQIGNFFYEQEEYRKASKYLESLVHAKPTTEKELQLTFRLAYSYFKTSRNKEAYRTFSILQNKENVYYPQANHYMSFIAYQLEEYEKAIEYSQNSKANPDFIESANDIIIKSYFALSDCEELSNYLSSIANEAHSVELFYLAGHCAFLAQEYSMAEEWLHRYKLNMPTLADSVAYQLLLSQYKLQKNNEFLDFSTTHNWSTEFEQPVLQLTAMVYQQMEQYKKAAIAFERLAQIQPSLAAQANYSKLNMLYLEGEYDILIEESRFYTERYPNSSHIAQVIELTSNAIEQTQGAKAAMRYAKKNRSLLKNQEAFVALNKKAIKQTYNQRNFDELFMLLDEFESVATSSEQDFLSFYRAEANFQINQTDEAIKFYTQVPSSSKFYTSTLYGLGSAYYNKGENNAALKEKAFQLLNQYLNRSSYEQLSTAKVAEAYARIGNIYADNKQYHEAEVIFMRALTLEEAETEFIYYSLGQIYRSQKQYEKAHREFDKVLQSESSVYASLALYKKAEMYQQQGNLDAAFSYFDSFIKKYPQSIAIPLALLSRGSLYTSKNRFEEAKNDFVAVIYNNPASIATPTAMESLKGLYEDGLVVVPNFNEVQNLYAKYHKDYTPTQVPTTVLSNDTEQAIAQEFQQSEDLYKAGEYSFAVVNLKKLASNKDLAKTLYYDKVYYYLGLAYAQTGDNTKSIENLKRVGGGLKFAAVLAIGDVEFNRENYNNALDQYTNLAKVTTDEGFKVRAWQGLTKTYFEMRDYKSTKDYVALLKTKTGYYDRDFVQLYTYKLQAAQGNVDDAIKGFEKLGRSKQTNPTYAAEALYEMANLMYELGSEESAKSILADLKNEFASQKQVQQKADKLAMLLK